MEDKKKITPEQALQNIGNALGHESLKLNQIEHLTLIDSFSILKEIILKKSEEIPPNGEPIPNENSIETKEE